MKLETGWIFIEIDIINEKGWGEKYNAGKPAIYYCFVIVINRV